MIKANFSAYNNYVTDSLYQWDIDQDLVIYGLNLSVAPEVHFANANMDRAIVRQSTLSDGIVTVRIPNSVLQESLTVKAYIGRYIDSTFTCIETIEIPIIAKARPSDYSISDADEEIYSFNRLENEIANAEKNIADKCDSNLVAMRATIEAETKALDARIDNIIAYNVDTDSNTELIDIRTAADGTVYDTAGAAVRGQVNNLASNIEANKNCFDTIINNMVELGLDNVLTLDQLPDLVVYENTRIGGYDTSLKKPLLRDHKGVTVVDFNMRDLVNMGVETITVSANLPGDVAVTNSVVIYIDGEYASNNWRGTVENNRRTIPINEYSGLAERIAIMLNSTEIWLTCTRKNETVEDNNIMTTVAMFSSIGAIGDSYTAGDTTNSSGAWVNSGANWVKTMANRASITYGNYGQGGKSCKNYDVSGVLNGPVHDMYFFAMGINDATKLYNADNETTPLDHLGSISDIDDSNYNNNADTFYGNYGKIIAQTMAHAPNAKFCMILIPLPSDATKDAFNNAIIEIANHYNIPYFNPYDDNFFNTALYTTKATGHPTRAGYVGMGLAYERLFSKVVERNPNYFLYSIIG